MTPLLTQLHIRIAELVPGVKKLSFGCEVFIQNFHVSVTIIEDRRGQVWLPESGEPNVDFLGWTGHDIQYFNFDHIKEIIGHPITLAHVLRAIVKVSPPFSQGIILSSKDVKEILAVWNLSLNLDDQSTEVHAFIGKIIL